MSLRLKLVIIVVLVALVPLGISAWTTLALHQRAFEGRTAELHRHAVQAGARTLRNHLERTQGSLTQAVRAIAWDALTEEERSGALWLIFNQVEEIAVVTLLDEEGRGVVASAYLADDAQHEPAYARHPRVTVPLLAEFSTLIPFTEARRGEFAFGRVFPGLEQGGPLLPLAIPVKGRGGAPWTVAVAVSLAPLCGEVRSGGAKDASAYLLDPDGRAICSPSGAVAAADAPLLAALRQAEDGALVRFRSTRGEDRIAAFAATASGWSVVVEQAEAVAYAANARMWKQSVASLAFALVLSLVTGLVLARRILRPIRTLLGGAVEIAKGRFERRLPVESSDELGQLSGAFNDMSTEVEAREREIRALNADLQRRVEERTRELREAQEQLLHSQKMAAVTGLGAGFAHEINNPLTSVLGLTQVLANRAEKRGADELEKKILTSINDEAHRIRKVVRTLLSLSQNDADGDGASRDVEVHELIDDSIVLVQNKLAQAQIEVIRHYQQPLPKIRGNTTQLRQALINLFNNSRAAMAQAGGRLTITTADVAGQAVKIEVSDTGRGIPPEHLGKIFDPFFTTKDEWRSEGLGLTVASRVVEQHKGRIQVHSEVGKGTTLTITLPVAPTGAHLA